MILIDPLIFFFTQQGTLDCSAKASEGCWASARHTVANQILLTPTPPPPHPKWSILSPMRVQLMMHLLCVKANFKILGNVWELLKILVRRLNEEKSLHYSQPGLPTEPVGSVHLCLSVPEEWGGTFSFYCNPDFKKRSSRAIIEHHDLRQYSVYISKFNCC